MACTSQTIGIFPCYACASFTCSHASRWGGAMCISKFVEGGIGGLYPVLSFLELAPSVCFSASIDPNSPTNGNL